MLCEHCGTRRAEIHLVNVVNGERHVQHLCRECAGEYFKIDDATNLMRMSFLVEGLMGIDQAFRDLVMPALRSAYAHKKENRRVCPHCGGVLPDSMFERKDDETAPVENAAPAAEEGIMTAEEEMFSLERKMREAVKAEDYETAAKLRDRMAELKNTDIKNADINEANGEHNV